MDFCENITQFVEDVVNNNRIEIIVERNPEQVERKVTRWPC
jgi:hypothetical protein